MPLVRKPAVSAAPESLDPSAVREMLARGSDEQRWEAARAFPDIGESPRVLGAALEREVNPRIREAMFTSLSRMATDESVKVVLPFLRSDDAQLRTGAADSLQAMKTRISPYMPGLLADADTDVRVLACELVRGLPGDEPARWLATLLESETHPNVCAAAVEVLAEIGGTDALAALERCATRFQDTPFLMFSIQFAADRIRSHSAARSD
jgi:HEAT repeat protein